MRIPVEQGRWRRSLIAETVASSHVSAPCYGAPEDVLVVPIVESEGELVEIERQIFLAHVVVRPDDSALEQRPESFNRVRVNDAADILVVAMTDDVVRESGIYHRVVAFVFVGHDQPDAARNGFM